jgi:hypothetical protein
MTVFPCSVLKVGHSCSDLKPSIPEMGEKCDLFQAFPGVSLRYLGEHVAGSDEKGRGQGKRGSCDATPFYARELMR